MITSQPWFHFHFVGMYACLENNSVNATDIVIKVLTHGPLGDVAIILKVYFSNLSYGLNS